MAAALVTFAAEVKEALEEDETVDFATDEVFFELIDRALFGTTSVEKSSISREATYAGGLLGITGIIRLSMSLG